jgi:hypothetical protein
MPETDDLTVNKKKRKKPISALQCKLDATSYEAVVVWHERAPQHLTRQGTKMSDGFTVETTYPKTGRTIAVIWAGEQRIVGIAPSRSHLPMTPHDRKVGRDIALGRAAHLLAEMQEVINGRGEHVTRLAYYFNRNLGAPFGGLPLWLFWKNEDLDRMGLDRYAYVIARETIGAAIDRAKAHRDRRADRREAQQHGTT